MMSKLHVQIDYFPWRVQDGLLRFQALEILDIRADANTIEEGKVKMMDALKEYAREYYSKGYDHHFRRRYHQPYINDGRLYIKMNRLSEMPWPHQTKICIGYLPTLMTSLFARFSG